MHKGVIPLDIGVDQTGALGSSELGSMGSDNHAEVNNEQSSKGEAGRHRRRQRGPWEIIDSTWGID